MDPGYRWQANPAASISTVLQRTQRLKCINFILLVIDNHLHLDYYSISQIL